MRLKSHKRMLALALALLLLFSPSIFDYLYLSSLRGQPASCTQTDSPDGAYVLQSCTLKKRRLLEFTYNTAIEDLRVIEQASGQVVHAGTLFDADYNAMTPIWTACAQLPEDKRPPSAPPGAVCAVTWATSIGACSVWNEGDYRAYLPPTLGVLPEPVQLKTQLYWPWTAYRRIFGC